MIDPEDIDGTTGLPRLPKGYFWRVNRGGGVYDISPSVELRKRVLSVFSRRIEVSWIANQLRGSVHDMRLGIRECAEVCAWKFNRAEEAKAAAREVEHLYGDYPPNTLNN